MAHTLCLETQETPRSLIYQGVFTASPGRAAKPRETRIW
jgi:hypothetical protein